MVIPRRPIIIQAAIEQDGARVISDEGGSIFTKGALVPWDQINCSTSYYQLTDEDGEGLFFEGRKVFLRFGSYWKSPQRSTRLKIQQAKKSWYKDPKNEFEIQLLPQRIKEVAREAAGPEFVFGILFLFLAAFNSVPALNRPNPIARTVDHWVVLGIWIVSFVLITHSVSVYYRLIKSTWVVVATHDGVFVQDLKRDRFIPWSKIELLRKRFILDRLLIDGKSLAYLCPSSEIRLMLESRLLLPRPKLFTGAFFLILILSIASGPCMVLFYQYLQIPLTLNWTVVSGVGLFFCGILVLHHYLELKEFRKASESVEHEIPMTL